MMEEMPKMVETLKRPGMPAMMAALVAVFCLSQAIFGERAPWEGGIPGDTKVYAPLVRDFSGKLLRKEIDSYYIQRSLPAALVHFALRAAGRPFDIRNMNGAFLCLDSACLIAAAYLWGRIAGRWALPPGLAWLGLSALFLNYSVGYFVFSTPLYTDPCAFLLGVTLLDRYVAEDSVGLLITGVVGAFVWPTALVTCLVLHVFDDRAPGRPGRADRLIGGAITGAYVALIVAWFTARKLGRGQFLITFHATPIVESVLLLSLVCLLLQFVVSGYPFLTMIRYTSIPGLFRTRRMAAAAAVFVAVKAVQYVLANRNFTYGASSLFNSVWSYSIARPFISVVAFATFYGPVVCVIILWWATFVRTVQALGRGFPALFGMIMFLVIGCEPRWILLHFPFFAAVAIKALDGPGWGRRSAGLFVFLGFLSSKVWLRYLAEVQANPASVTGDNQAFPEQYTYMSLGPWINNTIYLATGLALILALMAFAILSLAEEHPGGVSDGVEPVPHDRGSADVGES